MLKAKQEPIAEAVHEYITMRNVPADVVERVREKARAAGVSIQLRPCMLWAVTQFANADDPARPPGALACPPGD